MGDQQEKPTRLTLADLDHSYTGKGLILKESDAIELRDRVMKAHREDFDGLEDVIETIATDIAEDEENVSEESWEGALLFKEKLMEVFELEG